MCSHVLVVGCDTCRSDGMRRCAKWCRVRRGIVWRMCLAVLERRRVIAVMRRCGARMISSIDG